MDPLQLGDPRCPGDRRPPGGRGAPVGCFGARGVAPAVRARRPRARSDRRQGRGRLSRRIRDAEAAPGRVTSERADRLAELVAFEGLDQLIVGDLVRPGDSGPDAIANARWLTGFTGSSAIVVIGPDIRTFITDFRYTERAEAEVGDAFERVTATGRLFTELAEHLKGRVGFDDDATSVAQLAKLKEELGEGVELVAAGGLVERLRRRKDDAEIAAIA